MPLVTSSSHSANKCLVEDSNALSLAKCNEIGAFMACSARLCATNAARASLFNAREFCSSFGSGRCLEPSSSALCNRLPNAVYAKDNASDAFVALVTNSFVLELTSMTVSSVSSLMASLNVIMAPLRLFFHNTRAALEVSKSPTAFASATFISVRISCARSNRFSAVFKSSFANSLLLVAISKIFCRRFSFSFTTVSRVMVSFTACMADCNVHFALECAKRDFSNSALDNAASASPVLAQCVKIVKATGCCRSRRGDVALPVLVGEEPPLAAAEVVES
mmetsp:Transcript_7200/g.22405  ORF Transcript_7200/g.22405 Transcript_7200/m.22405 type:complete len:278 (+) Transcript_7200:3072-3905(+)